MKYENGEETYEIVPAEGYALPDEDEIADNIVVDNATIKSYSQTTGELVIATSNLANDNSSITLPPFLFLSQIQILDLNFFYIMDDINDIYF